MYLFFNPCGCFYIIPEPLMHPKWLLYFCNGDSLTNGLLQ